MKVQGSMHWIIHKLSSHLQSRSLFLTFRNPFLQHLPVPWLESYLERLRFGGQCRRNGIALNCIHNRRICWAPCRVHGERHDEPDIRRVELAVGQMRASTHPRAGAVAVVRRARCFTQVEIALRDELEGVFEVFVVVVGRPCVLLGQFSIYYSIGRVKEHTMKNVVPAGMRAPL